MSKLDGQYRERRLVEGVTTDGDFPQGTEFNDYLRLADGTDASEFAIAIHGTLEGSETISLVFFTETDDQGTLEELPIPSQFQFTSKPAPQRFRIPKHMPFKVRASGTGATTNFGVNLHPIR